MKKYLLSILMVLLVFVHANSTFAASYSDEWMYLTSESGLVTDGIKKYTYYSSNIFKNQEALANLYMEKGKLDTLDLMRAATVNYRLYLISKFDMKKKKLAQTYYEASNNYLNQYARSKGISELTAQRNLLYNLSQLKDHPEIVGNVMDYLTTALPDDPIMFTIYMGHQFNYGLPVNTFRLKNARGRFPNIVDFVLFEALYDKDLDETIFDSIDKFDWSGYQRIRPLREFFVALDYQIDVNRKAKEEARRRAEEKARYEEFLRNHQHNWETLYWCNNHNKYLSNNYCTDGLGYENGMVITCDMRPSVSTIYRCTICGARG